MQRNKGWKGGWGAVVLLLPLAVQAQSWSKTETLEYQDDTTLWVLGQVKRTTTDGVETSRTTYGWKALPTQTYSFGKLRQTLTYDSTSAVASGQLGTVKTVADGNSNVTTLGSWKRGIPQSIVYADSTTQSAVVDNLGQIASVTDETGSKTCYTYDAMGRMASITYPSETTAGVCDASTWTSKTTEFRPMTAAEWRPAGIGAGQWRHYEATGNHIKLTYYDALWRPVLTHAYDAANTAGTLRANSLEYDGNGRVVFQSYPSSDLIPAATGAWTTYDALGRVKQVKQDSELGPLATTTEYLPGFKTRVTNPRGVQTVTEYQAFDVPATEAPVTIVALGGLAGSDIAVTEIERDVFGKPKRIRRRDGDNSIRVDRYYVYDQQQQLCKAVEPETGTSLYLYDGAGNLRYSASGLNLPDPNDCNIEPGRPAIARTYDTRNRLQTLLFPDGLGDQSWTYTADGLPASVTTQNSHPSVNGGSPVVNAYTYNHRRLLTGESTQQVGWYTWGIGYGYDGLGNLATQTYPTGLAISYFPNALGQSTQVRDQAAQPYATGIQYYPNGAIKQFTYGNGIFHEMTQNARQLPARVTDGFGSMDYDYGYDANGNVAYIYDYIPDLTPGSTPRHRYMTYDGLDRLTGTGSAIFGGSDHWHRFTYNALDNLTSWKHAGIKDYATYVYDSSNRLTGIQDSTGATIVGLSYGPQGNLLNKNGQGYNFDYGNRLRDVTGKEYYRYDGLGRRVMAWEPATDSILSVYSQGGQLVYEQDQRKAIAREHIYLAGSLLVTRERAFASSAPVPKYQHTDALGSPVAVTNALGQVIQRNDYEPYGKVINQPSYGGIGYTGHVQDAATGLTYMQQRYYDPGIGRFLSVDPVTAYSSPGANFNRYWYANNNPYKFKDPDGRVSQCGVSCDDERGDKVGRPVFSKAGIASSPARPESQSAGSGEGSDVPEDFYQLPQNLGEGGFYNYGTPAGGAGQYGTGKTLSVIFEVGHALTLAGEERQFGVGNMSLKGGGSFPPHRTHRDGLTIDVRPMNSMGARQPITWRSPGYDRAATQRLVDAFRATGEVRVIYFNDPSIKGVLPMPSHDNHLHIGINP